MSILNRQRASGSGGQPTGGYVISNSCRFNDNDSASATQTMSAPTSAKIFCISFWVKRCNITTGVAQQIMSSANVGAGYGQITFTTSDQLEWALQTSGGSNAGVQKTTRVFRDVSAWMHIFLLWNTPDSDSGDRMQMWINGVRETDFADEVEPSLNLDTETLNAGVAHSIGKNTDDNNKFPDIYLAEFVFIDGTVYSASDFGEFDDNGVWIPKDISCLTFSGTNTFWLDFAVAPGTGNGAGTDVSGEANHWTDSGLAANDQMSDSPSDDATANPVVGNYAVLNSVYESNTYVPAALSDGNLTAIDTDAARHALSTIALPSTGKWAFKVTYNSGTWFSMGLINGIDFPTNASSPHASADADALSQNASAIILYDDGSSHATGITKLSGGQNCECLVDMDAGTVKFYTQGSVVGTTITGVAATIAPSFYVYVESANVTVDFGQSGYTPSDSSYKTLCTANLPAPDVSDSSAAFQVHYYVGTGSAHAETFGGNSALAPDLVWIANRTGIDDSMIFDAIRGTTKWISSGYWPAPIKAEVTDANSLTAFSTDGFSVGTGDINTGSSNYGGYFWKGDGSGGATNEDGSIDSTVNVNTTAGISIIRWSGSGANATIGHGLNNAPGLVITRPFETTNHGAYWLEGLAGTHYLGFGDLSANDGSISDTSFWNSTVPSSTVFSVGSSVHTNTSGTDNMIAYAFEAIEGFSSFGKYIGNGSTDGSFIYTGFSPAFLIIKRGDSGGSVGALWDVEGSLFRNLWNNSWNYTERTTLCTSCNVFDALSNGFKLRATDANRNASGATYHYWAFAGGTSTRTDGPLGGEGVAQGRAR